MDEAIVLYARELPGGGVVSIEAEPDRRRPCRGRVLVERRGDTQRREGHAAPVIAEAEAGSQALVFRELYRIAADNVAIARGLIQWQSSRGTTA